MSEPKVESNALDVLMHQICGMCLDNAEGVSKADALKMIRRSYAYSGLGDADFDDVLDFMVAHKHIIVHNSVISRVNGTLLFYGYAFAHQSYRGILLPYEIVDPALQLAVYKINASQAAILEEAEHPGCN